MEVAGLTTAEAAERLQKDGPNSVAIKKASLLRGLLKWIFSPINLMLLAAMGLSFWTRRYFDGDFIAALVLFNIALNGYHHRKADGAVKELQDKLLITVSVKRNGDWQKISSDLLAQGDIIRLGVGDIVPADAVILSAENITANESAITGESLPRSKKIKDKLLSGSYITTGSGVARVYATGARTTYGQALVLVENATKRSLLESEILGIAYMLISVSLVAIAVLTLALSGSHLAFTDIARLDLSLLIAGTPVSLPTVMTIIISLGISGLAKKQVVVRRLGALENLANTNLLLTDKTGTLTQNHISVDSVNVYGQLSENDLVKYARGAIGDPDNNPIDRAIFEEAAKRGLKAGWEVKKHTPADSERKRNTALIEEDGRNILVSSGAPQVIASLCILSKKEEEKFYKAVERMASGGFRVIAVASTTKSEQESDMDLLGLISLSDPPRSDAASTLSDLHKEGIEVRMITGDNIAISQHLAAEIGIKGHIMPAEKLRGNKFPDLAHWWEHSGGFAEILPADKYRLTELAKQHNVVAVTGDGINDLPSLGAADVGVAVKNAVNALRQSADLVILTDGIHILLLAIVEARKIFERLYSYSVYRISESFRLIVTIAILGLAIHAFPLTPLQLILLAFLNDVPIVTLAYNHVKTTHRPANSKSSHKLLRGLLHGSIGIVSSLLFYGLLTSVWHLPLAVVQTAFFLKLTISGHLLIYVAHTDKRWFRFLPSQPVILATTITQLLATLAAGVGLLMTGIPLWLIAFIWLWAVLFMQVSDVLKYLVPKK